ncbi:hypothetical protein KIW84_055944 [Lathyrus oleraceus]|uniref:beta-galactosidase n=1 Tax=Pisum sativum TaxID=3888 RepID=A0A9D4WZ70_PEA|nr:hypothetical protein KIW84_055944 [Pisum sativum]
MEKDVLFFQVQSIIQEALWRCGPTLFKRPKMVALMPLKLIYFGIVTNVQREYNFSGNLDFVKFFKLIQEAGLYAIMRIGPYACAEWNYGGFPLWLHNIPGIELRTNNEVYKKEMQIFTTKIVNVAKEANLFASQGGPIVLAQIENEYGDIMWNYKDAGKEYVKWCAQMALAQILGFHGSCVSKGPHRSAEDSAFSVARFFQNGGVLNNYYMYHGGTNFGRTSGKGHAWVNGHSIGRYWASWVTAKNGCSDTCDYRGKYVKEKCNTNCGSPSQRWYHVPRSFLNDDMNILVLFEEIGGNPQSVQFQTVTTELFVANVYEGANSNYHAKVDK